MAASSVSMRITVVSQLKRSLAGDRSATRPEPVKLRRVTRRPSAELCTKLLISSMCANPRP